MRKALIGLILAATVMTPIAAEAQNRSRDRAERVRQLEERGQERAARQAQRAEQREQRQEARQQQAQPQPRQERRAERRQERQARQAPQQQQRVVRQRVQRQQAAAVAQRRGGERRGETRQRQSDYPQAWQGNPNDPRRSRYEQLERQNQYRYGTQEQRRDVRREVRQDRRDWRQDRRQDRRADRRDWRRDWNRSWRNDRRYDWNRWRYSNRNIFRLPSYYSPYRNHRYSRFSIGFFLQPLFYSQRYRIGNPYQYRLPAAPYGTQWVRYYNDVLLVDIYTGEVIDVIYDFFW